MYGVGENERLLSKVLATRRDEVVLATKFGNVRAPNGDFLRIDGSPEYVAQACDASLQRLGVDYIDMRSEEHTSELQSLMRTSYAVFCLKKKNTQTRNNKKKKK